MGVSPVAEFGRDARSGTRHAGAPRTVSGSDRARTLSAMIYDTFDHAARCFPAGSLLREAVAFAASFDGRREDGTFPVRGDDLHAILKRYTTFAPDEKRFETHRAYADVQVLLEGEEAIHVALLCESDATPLTPYDAATDKVYLQPPPDFTPILLRPGRFLVLFPGDVHRADCHWRGPTVVRKLCLKVRLAALPGFPS